MRKSKYVDEYPIKKPTLRNNDAIFLKSVNGGGMMSKMFDPGIVFSALKRFKHFVSKICHLSRKLYLRFTKLNFYFRSLNLLDNIDYATTVLQ